jgi:hypothetical protein
VHTEGRERSSANLRACCLLAALLTDVSDAALKLLLDDLLPLSSCSLTCFMVRGSPSGPSLSVLRLSEWQ